MARKKKSRAQSGSKKRSRSQSSKRNKRASRNWDDVGGEEFRTYHLPSGAKVQTNGYLTVVDASNDEPDGIGAVTEYYNERWRYR